MHDTHLQTDTDSHSFQAKFYEPILSECSQWRDVLHAFQGDVVVRDGGINEPHILIKVEKSAPTSEDLDRITINETYFDVEGGVVYVLQLVRSPKLLQLLSMSEWQHIQYMILTKSKPLDIQQWVLGTQETVLLMLPKYLPPWQHH